MSNVEHLRVRVFPDAAKRQVKLADGEDLIHVHVVASPASGAANREMLQLLGQYLQTGKQIRIVSGHRRPQKIIAITS